MEKEKKKGRRQRPTFRSLGSFFIPVANRAENTIHKKKVSSLVWLTLIENDLF